MIEAETEVENARRAAEHIALQHELEIARMRQDLQAIAQTEQRQKAAEDRHQETTDRLAATHQALDRIVAVAEPLLAAMAGHDAQAAHQAAERLASPEFGISAKAIQGLGYDVPRQALVESLHQKARADGQPVVIQKEDLLTRDIGAAKIKALPIGRSLTLLFRTSRPGYVTLMNVGTSGSVYVQIPNALVGVRAARAAVGQSYTVPGKDLFPWEGDYRERGPARLGTHGSDRLGRAADRRGHPGPLVAGLPYRAADRRRGAEPVGRPGRRAATAGRRACCRSWSAAVSCPGFQRQPPRRVCRTAGASTPDAVQSVQCLTGTDRGHTMKYLASVLCWRRSRAWLGLAAAAE